MFWVFVLNLLWGLSRILPEAEESRLLRLAKIHRMLSRIKSRITLLCFDRKIARELLPTHKLRLPIRMALLVVMEEAGSCPRCLVGETAAVKSEQKLYK